MQHQALATGSAGRTEHWIAAELHDVWLAAQAEADDAYWHWRDHPGAPAYAVYRAAQDRADAAQDRLARWLGQFSGGSAASA
jgi:hypothetical protein